MNNTPSFFHFQLNYSSSAAAREIGLIFPGRSKDKFERTCLVVKPEAVKYAGEVARKVEKAGFVIVKQVGLSLSEIRAEEFYKNSLVE